MSNCGLSVVHASEKTPRERLGPPALSSAGQPKGLLGGPGAGRLQWLASDEELALDQPAMVALGDRSHDSSVDDAKREALWGADGPSRSQLCEPPNTAVAQREWPHCRWGVQLVQAVEFEKPTSERLERGWLFG